RVGVHVHVAAPVADLRVAQTVELLRWRREALRMDLEALRPDADLAAVGPADGPLGDDDVAVVEPLGELPRRGLGIASREGDLEVAAVVAQPEEDELAQVAVLHDATRDLRRRARIGRLR